MMRGSWLANGPEEDAQGDVDILQIFAANDDWHITGLRAAVKDNWFLYPRDEKVSAFPYRDVLYSVELVALCPASHVM